MSATLKAANVDDRRRVVLPESCPPNSVVVIQQLDDHTWVIKRQDPEPGLVVIALRDVEHLPNDPKWEKVESALAKHASSRLAPPDFDE